jgi:hypothetical protein
MILVRQRSDRVRKPAVQADPELLIPPHFARGERLLWSGRPRAGIRVENKDVPGLGMGLFGLAFSVPQIVSMARSGDYGSLVFLVPFAIVWMSVAAGQPFWRAWRRRGVVYGLTEHRALVVRGTAGTEVQSVTLHAQPSIVLQEHRDRTGAIVFGSAEAKSRAQAPAFERIDDARLVYGLIRDAQVNAATPFGATV